MDTTPKATGNCQIRGLLKRVYVERKERNKAYSLSSFSKDLGISVSLLSRILSGERSVSLKLAMHVTTLLEVGEKQSKHIILSMLKAQSKNAKIKKHIRAKLESNLQATNISPEYTSVDIEQFKAIATWYHLAILSLIELRDFKSSTFWISKRLGISSTETIDAIERLFALGLITEVEGKIQRTKKSLFVKTRRSEFAVRKFHEQMISKALEELNETSQERFEKRLINGMTITCEDKHINLIKEKINQLQEEILNLTETAHATELYQMNVQLYPLTKKNSLVHP